MQNRCYNSQMLNDPRDTSIKFKLFENILNLNSRCPVHHTLLSIALKIKSICALDPKLLFPDVGAKWDPAAWPTIMKIAISCNQIKSFKCWNFRQILMPYGRIMYCLADATPGRDVSISLCYIIMITPIYCPISFNSTVTGHFGICWLEFSVEVFRLILRFYAFWTSEDLEVCNTYCFINWTCSRIIHTPISPSKKLSDLLMAGFYVESLTYFR